MDNDQALEKDRLLVAIEVTHEGNIKTWLAMDEDHFIQNVREKYTCEPGFMAATNALSANLKNTRIMSFDEALDFINAKNVHREAQKMTRSLLQFSDLI